jgi:hypothetical protein
MKIRKLVIDDIKKYSQINPFDSEKQRKLWEIYNVIRKEELKKFFKNKTQEEYNEYWDKVIELEHSRGQLAFF